MFKSRIQTETVEWKKDLPYGGPIFAEPAYKLVQLDIVMATRTLFSVRLDGRPIPPVGAEIYIEDQVLARAKVSNIEYRYHATGTEIFITANVDEVIYSAPEDEKDAHGERAFNEGVYWMMECRAEQQAAHI